jgi:peptidoglycan hydrolase-like protein with peptidoglycan-binding domain
MNSFYKIIFSLFLLLISASFVEAQTFNFYRSLSVGDTGQDVLELQRLLNQNPDTSIAISGPGSVGNETNYFGNLTKNALIKFQNKYRQEILTPVGLTYGTGYFGPSTISFIENNYVNDSSIILPNSPTEIDIQEVIDIINSSNNNENSDDETTEKNIDEAEVDTSEDVENNLVRLDSLELYFVSKPVFETGDELTVVGGNIGNDPEIYFFNFEDEKVVSRVNVDANFITFDAPNIKKGKYELYIKNDNYISNPLVVEVVDNFNPPKISSISPSTISYGDTVTIKGSNFEDENIIMTPLGTYTASSDGSKIEFYVQRPTNLNVNQIIAAPKEEEFEGLIQIQNSNGLSDAEFVDFLYN